VERHGGAIVVIRIVGIVSIELELVVIEVEERVVRPLAVGVPVLPIICPNHCELKL